MGPESGSQPTHETSSSRLTAYMGERLAQAEAAHQRTTPDPLGNFLDSSLRSVPTDKNLAQSVERLKMASLSIAHGDLRPAIPYLLEDIVEATWLVQPNLKTQAGKVQMEERRAQLEDLLRAAGGEMPDDLHLRAMVLKTYGRHQPDIRLGPLERLQLLGEHLSHK